MGQSAEPVSNFFSDIHAFTFCSKPSFVHSFSSIVCKNPHTSCNFSLASSSVLFFHTSNCGSYSNLSANTNPTSPTSSTSVAARSFSRATICCNHSICFLFLVSCFFKSPAFTKNGTHLSVN